MDAPLPTAISETGATLMIAMGGLATIACIAWSLRQHKQQKSFSLRFLMTLTITLGLYVGGVARLHWAKQETARQHEREMYDGNLLNGSQRRRP